MKLRLHVILQLRLHNMEVCREVPYAYQQDTEKYVRATN